MNASHAALQAYAHMVGLIVSWIELLEHNAAQAQSNAAAAASEFHLVAVSCACQGLHGSSAGMAHELPSMHASDQAWTELVCSLSKSSRGLAGIQLCRQLLTANQPDCIC